MQQKKNASQGFIVDFHLVIVITILQLSISHHATSKMGICLAKGYVLSFLCWLLVCLKV